MSEAVEHWVSTFDPGGGPGWLKTRRSEALGRFRERGFPTRREEAWKYTNPQRIAAISYRPAPVADLDAAVLGSLALVPAAGPRAVFVNGRFHPGASLLDPLPPGLACDVVGSTSAEPDLRELLAPTPSLGDRPFASLAEAFFEDGILLRAEPGAQVGESIRLVFLSTGADTAAGDPPASHPRVWVRAGAGSALSVQEIFLSLGEGSHLTNALSQYHAEDGAALSRTVVQAESAAATFLSTAAMRGGRDARLAHRSFSIGAGLCRDDLVCELAAPGAECVLRGLYVARGDQHSDHHTTVEHLEPHCNSRQLYRGVLDGRSRGAFTGTVVVRPQAQKSDAQQKNESLLLSEHAEADSKPQLEIYADDVKCSHGSTIGQLDADQIFFLRSRGIDAETARGMLIRGFASAIISELDDAALRDAIDAAIAEHLGRGQNE